MKKLMIHISKFNSVNQNFNTKNSFIGSAYSTVKAFTCLFLLFISLTLQAQQVTNTGCCVDVGNKATIIINNNTANSSPVNTTTVNSGFSFKLTAAANTSAGVYDGNGVLVRTLWSGVHYDAGCYAGQWDGFLDDGVTVAPLGNYIVKILTNNVQYDWLGVLGNSSTSHLANQILNPFHGMAITNGNMYIASGYAERDFKTNKISLSDIGSLYNAVDPTQAVTQTMWAEHVCTNGTYVFWAGGDPYSNAKSFIFASNPADDSQINFTHGQQVTIGIDGRQYHSAFVINTTNQIVTTGITANTNFLFATRGDNNVVEVYDLRNNSGALIQSLNLGNGTSTLACYSNYLWASVNSTAKQFFINTNGTLTATGVIINVNAGEMAISATGELAIADKDNQQLKFYNAITGIQTAVLGQASGYDLNGPLVTFDKFMFVDKRVPETKPAVTYQPDGSFWLSDPGNYRVLHFNADKSYKEQIAYVPTSRSINADPNNQTRVFADVLEYQVDYSKVATDINHSWVLKYNWGVGTDLDVFEQFRYVVSLSNGHTYALGKGHLYDLLPTGTVYLTDINGSANLEQDGSLWTRLNYNNDYMQVVKQNLTSFTTLQNGAQQPIWGNNITIATSSTYEQDATQPAFYYNNTVGASTNPNHYFFFHPVYSASMGLANNVATGNVYHLGSIKTGSNTWEWKTSKMPPSTYQGAYPQNGWFMADGHSENCLANVNGSNILWHVNCELGSFTEVSRTNHFNEDGLFIGHFGTDNQTVGYTGDTRFWAGNSFKTALVKVGADLYYFYCDESKHGGVHIIKASNLASVQELPPINVTVSAAVTVVADSTDLMFGLPYHGTSLGTATGWVIESGTPGIQTTVRQYDKNLNDIVVTGTTGDRIISRYLSNKTLTSYTLSGGVNFTGSQFTFTNFDIYNTLNLFDQNGKQIAIIYSRGDGIWVNNTQIAPYASKDQNLFQDFSFAYASGVLSVKFADYNPVVIGTTWQSGASISQPGYFKLVQHVANYRSDGVGLDIYNLKFVPGSAR